tara:strand:- start:356 stop:1009 length:654 start_codon:yes stop_codon:yes gene_type:complete
LIELLKKIVFLGQFKKTYSQDKEDLFIVDYFKDLDKGYYVDIGCHHPKRFSNTYLLYKNGWNGLNVDANKFAIILFKIFRVRDENLCAILSDSSQPVLFYEFNASALNGILSIDRVKKLIELGFYIKRKKIITPISIQNLIKKYELKTKKINFFKIDIEGLDFEIVKKMNLKNLDIDLIMIEKSSEKDNDKIIQYFKSQFYSPIHESNRNYIFEKNQ